MSNYFNHFPVGYTPNNQQDFILKELAKAKANNYKFIIINAQTGTGKSFISKTLANSIGAPSASFLDFVDRGVIYELDDDEVDESNEIQPEGAAVLTMTKALQDQYHELFNDTDILKGKGNYPCALASNLSCDIGVCSFEPDQKDLCIGCGQCEYYNNRDNAVKSQCSLYSYSMFLSLPPACQVKKVLVCDEASELEDILVQNYTIPFIFKIINKLDITLPPTPTKNSSYEKYILWLRSVKSIIFSNLNDLRKKFKSKNAKNIKKEEKIKFKAINILNDSCDKILKAIKLSEFVIEHNKDAIIFKPLKIDKLAQNIFKRSELVILMSATIIDHKNFAKQLGIKNNQYYYIEAPSTFDPKKAPIKLSNSISVTYANKAITIPKLCTVAKEICKIHKDQKGIIHTHTMDITSEIKNTFGEDPRFLYREKGVTNEDLIDQHCNTLNPTVLVSPSMTHGIDLKGALGEFAIIIKAPFLPLGDKRVKRLCDEDSEWYLDKMLSRFIQMCGRTIRSANDTSITYVLDATLTKKLLQMKDKIPKYILERFC